MKMYDTYINIYILKSLFTYFDVCIIHFCLAAKKCRLHTSRNVKKCAGHLDRQVLPFAGPNANLPVLACFLFTVLSNCAFFLPDIWTGRSSAPASPNANLPVRTGRPAHFAMYALHNHLFKISLCNGHFLTPINHS
jgi:hypothetical protein